MKTIGIFLRENDNPVAIVEVNENKLRYTCYDQDLKKYFDENASILEKKVFGQPTGGQEPNGVIWDGFEEADISSPNYLIGLWRHLDSDVKKQVFNMKYYFVPMGF